MKIRYCCIALLMLLGCRSPAPEGVILIVVDTLRADHLGFYGYERDTSPELDEWSRRGLIFEQALSTSPWTLPTFGSMLTGLMPFRHGAGERIREADERFKRAPLRSSVPTLPEALAQRGWQTAAVVSNPFLREHFGLARGFETYDYERGRTADAVVDRALELLDRLQERPFFLLVHLIDPHLPYRAPKEFRGRFSAAPTDEAIGKSRKEILAVLDQLSDEDRRQIVDRYDEEILFVDHELGRFLDQLEQRRMLDRSLVLLTSDHGEELFDHGEFEHGHAMHQELLRVPLVMWAPGLLPGRVSSPFSLVDLAQTLFVATQGETSRTLSGTSRWESIHGGRAEPGQAIVAENTLWTSEKKALVRWPYKFILDLKTGRHELYDLEADPEEKSDLAAIESELTDRMEQALKEILAIAEPESSREAITISDETEDELRALGYLD